MDSTANYGFVIPSDDGSDLMDADLWRTPIGQVDAKLKQLYDGQKALMDGSGNTLLTTTDVGFAISTGWTLGLFQAVSRYGFAAVRLEVTKTSPAIANTSDGNLVNTAIATFNASSAGGKKILPILPYAGLTTGQAGQMVEAYCYAAGAQFAISAMAPGPGIGIGASLTLLGCWAVAI